ncbi:FecR domain-containing protein [Parabacteroides faecis]|uniref:FecR family protein n=1 Tax=Parabacteroides faecis TaxID=1217282 RepID=UPI0021647123|nr:FecR domain-containing protein [Parabacteroides faecis]MCS2891018.1 FecR domain-containing protein [Parabacteroides faecis]UVQ45330.1 FecR domain-containing protein [Parabacteroides faecis]
MEKQDYIQLFDKFLLKQASPEEVQMLIQWLKSEGSFQDWMDEEWDAASSGMDTDLQQKLLGQIKQKISLEMQQAPLKRNKYRTIYLWTARIASVIILLLLTGISVYRYAMEQQKMQDMIVSVEKGQKANVVLPDGSKVWVNSDSRLIYGSRFTSKERILELEGEAYFEVAPDKDRPFIVETKNISVKALGTSFDVKSYKEDNWVSAVLMTGKVEVWSENEKLILEPNQRILFDKSTGKMEKSRVMDATDFSGWMYNTLSFEAETFENIVQTLQRLYNTKIVFESESLKKYRFTGSPGNTSLESILQILSLTSPLSYEVKDSVIVLRENKKEKAWYEKALK